MDKEELYKIKENIEFLVKDVGKIVKEGFENRAPVISTKRDANDLLTEYDIKTNDLILKFVRKNYPDFTIYSEEAEKEVGSNDYSFLIDPIDGTRNFVRGIPIFFVGVGLAKGNDVIFSMTYNPISQDLFYAIKGEGAYLNGVKINVSDRGLETSDIQCEFPFDVNLAKEVMVKLRNKVCSLKTDYCAHYDITGVACDRFDALLSIGPQSWDFCHYLLVEEAGGKVTDWNGEKFDLSKDNIILSNGVIHDDLLKLLKR